MIARWASFGVGLWLMLAPLVLGYGSVAPILQGVAVGCLVCIATLVALDHPRARFGLAGVGLWLALDARGGTDAQAAVASLGAGALLFLLSFVPSAPRAAARAGARA
ncbi:MAG: hypothetical protein QM704_28095 [Anaeromyxobacteraceae bacterium]